MTEEVEEAFDLYPCTLKVVPIFEVIICILYSLKKHLICYSVGH